MINSVQNIKSVEHRPFAEFNQKGEYYLSRKTAKDIFDLQEKDKDKKGKKVGFIIAGASVITALGVFALTKGLPKNTYKWLEKFGQRLEDNVNSRKLRGESGPITSVFNYTLKKVKQLGEKAESINNLSSFKDILFKKLMFKTSFTEKIHSKVSNLFEKLARKTVTRKYNKFDNKYAELFDTYKSLNKKLVSANPQKAEVISKIETIMQSIDKQTQKGFGKEARLNRYSEMRESMKSLDKRVMDAALNGMNVSESVKQNFVHLKDSKVHKSFIAEDLLSANKIGCSKAVDSLRRQVTHDIFDNYRASERLVANLSDFINPKDAQSSELLKNLKGILSTYKKLSGPYESKHRELLNSEIADTLKQLSERIIGSADKFNYNNSAVQQITSYISEIEQVLAKNDKGQFQELLTLYKSVLPRDAYIKLRTQTNNTIKSLDKAINTETNSFFDKLRDLSLGAAPTDVLTILGSVLGVGIGLTKAENRDERISATLKYGIPVIGAVATSIAMTICLVSGGLAMGAGLASGFIMNQIGKRIDLHRKQITKHFEDNKNAQNIKAEINAQKA